MSFRRLANRAEKGRAVLKEETISRGQKSEEVPSVAEIKELWQ